MGDQAEATKAIRVLVVDDHPVVLAGLRELLGPPDFEVVGEAMSGQEALSLVQSLAPDVVVLDIRLPDIDGMEVLKRLKVEAPGVPVLMLTAFSSPNYLLGAVLGGAAGFLLKGSDGMDLMKTVRRAALGEDCLPRECWVPMFKKLSTEEAVRLKPSTDGWSPREIHTLNCLAKGFSNARISETLGLKENTVRFYVKKIFAKLGASDRTQAVINAIKKGVISLPEFED